MNIIRTSVRLWVQGPEKIKTKLEKKAMEEKKEIYTKQNKNQTACPRRGQWSFYPSVLSQEEDPPPPREVFPEARVLSPRFSIPHLQLTSLAGHCESPGATFPTATQAEGEETIWSLANLPAISNVSLAHDESLLLEEQKNHMC